MKNNQFHRPAGRSGRLAVMFLCALLSACFFAPTAMAAETPTSIRTISVSSVRPDGVGLTYTNILNAPVTQSESDEIRQQMSRQLTQQELPAAARDPFQPFQLACGQEAEQNEPSQGKLNVRLRCLPTHAEVDWGFKLAPALQSTVVGAVSEDGMRHWRKGKEEPKNSPHREPANHHFHGTLNPVFIHEHIQFQDFFRWRNTMGTTTVLAVVSSVDLG